ncbi:MAG TPA: hypothetical protein VNU97_19495 [Rhizomicrobium sp.]|jgi:hypothetical protein|nr:hypothetical protein [Rhizomicrobium sp.]
MRRLVSSVAFAASFAAFVAAASAQTAPATPPAPVAPAPVAAAPTDNDDVVSCRYEKTIGSLFAKRVCHTQREWHQMTTDSRNLMDNLDAHSHVSGIPGGGN